MALHRFSAASQIAWMVSRMRLLAASKDWYVFRVRPRHEKLVSMSLRGKGYEEFLPLTQSKRRWADRSTVIELPLFPGYVFCDIERPEIGKILCTYGIIDVIRAGSSPLPASRSEIEGLRKASEAELQLESWPYVDSSATGGLRILSGPLTGLEGILVQVRGKERLVLSVDLLRRSVLVELPSSCVAFGSRRPAYPSNSSTTFLRSGTKS
jgi:transcription antitermination factor NusG